MVLLHAFDYLIAPTIEFAHFCRGFRYKRTTVAAFDWHYIQREGSASQTTEPVVFVHGFSSWKGSWVKTASLVDEKYQVVIPDMPGHGRTEPKDHLAGYGANEQAQRLHVFMENAIEPEQKVHLVGVSMGGLIAGVYAAMYPDRVRSLTLICAAGLTMPQKSNAYKLMENSVSNPLLPRTADEIIELTSYMSHRPKFPRFLAPILAAFRERNFKTDEMIFNDMTAKPTLLEDYLPHIRARTLLMWGKNDRILDPSSLSVLDEKITNPEAKYILPIDECGHMLHFEQSEVCANAINAFIHGEDPTSVVEAFRSASSKADIQR
ncbi:hypothetical protein Poli38472_006446 [Pythium oligandrum]|uniref:AB hydrolase-1 domain-containing protein n=1 Tax=Pythium oligandrum TaxID=41045 RepID=A0A8K1C4L9_PYTOL|nr:hypothetical protein Poli38472_006446 [Pythium oligandrum]|eukprot:TMW56436.1 hypothetical protein Poli38472_006446 [Pythium oligandrum]